MKNKICETIKYYIITGMVILIINLINIKMEAKAAYIFDNKNIINYVLLPAIIMIPISTIVHEYGHAIVVRLFGGVVTEIHIGSGRILFNYRNLFVHAFFVNSGYYRYKNLKMNNKMNKIIIHLGGVLFNIISVCILIILILTHLIEANYYLMLFILINEYSIICLLPLSYNGYNSDGMQIYQLLIYGKSEFIKSN